MIVSVEKVIFKGTEITSDIARSRAHKLQSLLQTVEYNAERRGMQINKQKNKNAMHLCRNKLYPGGFH